MSQLIQLLINYRTGYLPVILVALGFVAFRWRSVKGASMRWPLFLALAAGPVLLDHLLLLQYAGHDFAALKGGVLLCALVGIGLSVLRTRWAVSGLVFTCVVGVLYFWRTNSPSDADLSYPQRTGEALSTIAGSDEMIFTLGFTADPQTQWYVKRTLFRVDSVDQARVLLRAQGTKQGVVFRDGYLPSAFHISE